MEVEELKAIITSQPEALKELFKVNWRGNAHLFTCYSRFLVVRN
jgi:hypothetical protein